jgi:AraC family transcriptional regulator
VNLSPETKASASFPLDDRVRDALAYLEAHLREPLSLAAVARHAGVSRDHLPRLFRRDTGRTPMKILRVMRLELAERLLSTTSLSVKEVAARVGAPGPDPSHFMRNFRPFNGLSPGQYGKASGERAGGGRSD